MPLYSPIIPARYVLPLLERLHREQPEAWQAILGDSQLAGSLQPGTDSSLTAQQFDRLLAVASERLGRDDLGFEIGRGVSIDSHLALGRLLRNCTTINQLLQTTAHYWRLITTCLIFSYRRYADHAELTLRPSAPMSSRVLHALQETTAVSFHLDATAMLGGRSGLQIELSMPAPAHIERYRRLRPTEFHFGCGALPQVCFRIPAALLELPLRQPSGRPLTSAERLPDEQPRHAAPTGGHTQWVSLILQEAEGLQPSREVLAELLNISPRSLTRQLALEGCNLRELSKRIRQQRACAMLRDRSQPIAQIAERLGYADASSFCHAFRQLAGISPNRYRGTLLTPPAVIAGSLNAFELRAATDR